MNKKIFAAAVASVMAVTCAATVSAEQVTANKTYDGGLVVDGSSGWNSAGSGDTYVITEGGVTVTLTNEPFIRDADNWSNFVFETLATDAAAGITLRADAYAWTYGDNTDNVPTWEATTSWGDDWSGFAATAPGKVELTVKKASASTVTAHILYANGGTVDYTVTYPAGVPAGLEFQVGADGGKITLESVAFAGSETSAPADDNNAPADDNNAPADDNNAPADDNNASAGDNTASNNSGAGNTNAPTSSNKGNADTGVEGVAVVAGLAIVAAGAVVIAKKRK